MTDNEEEDEHTPFSYDYPSIFNEIIEDLDLRKGYIYTLKAFNQFPKSKEDSIFCMILEGIYSSLKDIKRKLLVELLMKYYNHLVDLKSL